MFRLEKIFFCQGTPPPRNSKKLLWPRGGHMPLAFMQEDFLVYKIFRQPNETNICPVTGGRWKWRSTNCKHDWVISINCPHMISNSVEVGVSSLPSNSRPFRKKIMFFQITFAEFKWHDYQELPMSGISYILR